MLTPVPLVPEISLDLAGAGRGLFDDGFRSDRPPPFWRFAWAGGQALARYLLDRPGTVAGRRVLDIGTGSGLVAIAAARAGAATVAPDDTDPEAVDAAHRNAAANGVTLAATVAGPEVVLAGDAFYTERVAGQLTPRLLAARSAGARVLVGDPGRGFFPERLFEKRAEYVVPVRAALEDSETLLTAVWEMRSTHNQLYAANI